MVTPKQKRGTIIVGTYRGRRTGGAEGKGEIAPGRRFVSLSPSNKRSLCCGCLFERRPVMNGKIFNSKGIHVGTVTGAAIFDLKGQKLYDLKGVNIDRMSGELVGFKRRARH